ncbi:MAG: hypothetical protein AB7C97_05060 [Oscillospiraceae bacterium]
MLSVLEAEGEGIASVLATLCGITVAGGEKTRRARNLRADVIILSRSGVSLLSDGGKKAVCRILVLPGSAVASFSGPEKKITYGMAASDDVTFSSVSDSKCILAVQRELTVLSGAVVERQEFPVVKPEGVSPENLMAAYAGLLAGGIIV